MGPRGFSNINIGLCTCLHVPTCLPCQLTKAQVFLPYNDCTPHSHSSQKQAKLSLVIRAAKRSSVVGETLLSMHLTAWWTLSTPLARVHQAVRCVLGSSSPTAACSNLCTDPADVRDGDVAAVTGAFVTLLLCLDSPSSCNYLQSWPDTLHATYSMFKGLCSGLKAPFCVVSRQTHIWQQHDIASIPIINILLALLMQTCWHRTVAC